MRKRFPVMDLLLLIGAMIFLFLAVKEYAPFYLNDKKMDELREEVFTDEEKEDSAEANAKDRPNINWKKLKAKNKDIIAWIRVPGTKIDYPVLKCHQWNEYLHTDYKNKYNYVGSIFIQPKTSSDFTDRHTIIYGHNMANKSMFGSLHKYEEKSFYRKHKYFYIYQPDCTIKAEVCSTYDCKDTGSTYETEFNDQETWADWIGMIVKARYYHTDKDPAITDKIITLSTCSNGRGHSSRYVVHGIIVNVEKYCN